MTCLCMVSSSIGHLYHLLRSVYWYICHCGFLWDFYMSFHSLSHSCYAFGLLGVLWEFYGILCFLVMVDMYWVWEMSDLLLGSPDHCLIHHSIIGDMTFLYCTNMSWSSFIPLSYCLTLYLLTHFQIFVPLFIHFLHIDTHFLFWYLLHIIHMFHWWFDYSSFSHFATVISFAYL